MNREEALQILKEAPRDNTPSRVNPAFTTGAEVAIVEKSVEDMKEGKTLDALTEKRVLQVTQNRKRPKRTQ